MNWAAVLVLLVPAAVVTVTKAGPVPAGEVAVQIVTLGQGAVVAAALPNLTLVAPGTKPAPVIVTVVPPAKAPVGGAIA